MFKVGTSHFRFVHDKVREAAYSLISDEERDKVSVAWL
jgi:predicted ATPase